MRPGKRERAAAKAAKLIRTAAIERIVKDEKHRLTFGNIPNSWGWEPKARNQASSLFDGNRLKGIKRLPVVREASLPVETPRPTILLKRK